MNGQIVADTLVALARLALFAYAIQSGRAFLLHWLDSRAGLPLLTTSKPLSRNDAIDAARKFGLGETELANAATTKKLALA